MLAVPLMIYWSVRLAASRRRCLQAVLELVAQAGTAAGLGSGALADDSAEEEDEIFSIKRHESPSLAAERGIAAAAQE